MPWTLLGILLAVCAVLCAVGFYKFVYFLSIGYGFAVAGGGLAIFIMYHLNQHEPDWSSRRIHQIHNKDCKAASGYSESVTDGEEINKFIKSYRAQYCTYCKKDTK